MKDSLVKVLAALVAAALARGVAAEVLLDLGFNATSLFEFELEYAYFKTHFTEDPCCIFTPPPTGLGDLKIQYFMGYATFNFGGTNRFIPYFTVGAGAANLDPDVPGFPNLDSDTRFTLGIGGGVKWFFTPNFALRFDGRK